MSRSAKFLVPLISALVALLIAEGLIRLVLPQNTDFYDYAKFARPAGLPWQDAELIPGASNPTYTGVSVQINSLGLRDDEVQQPKPDNNYRIVAIGDSITFGYGVELHDLYFKVLEKNLNSQLPPGPRYEVLNGGLIAGSMDYYYHFLRQRGPELKPDLILLGIVLNDIKPYSDETLIVQEPVAVSVTEDVGVVRSISGWFQKNSHLYQMFYATLKGLLFSTGILDINELHGYDFVALQENSPSLAKAWRKSDWMLESIVGLAREQGIPIAFVVFPLEVQLNADALDFYRDALGLELDSSALSGAPQHHIAEVGSRLGVPVIDLLPEYKKHSAEKLYLRNKSISADPVHPSVYGHLVAGDEIFRSLMSQGVLPPHAAD